MSSRINGSSHGSKSSLVKIDILCVEELKHKSQQGTYNPLHSFDEGDIRLAFELHSQLQFAHPQRVRIYTTSGVRGFAVAHHIATRSVDFITSRKGLSVIQELGNIPEKHVMPQDAVRRIFENLDGATRIVVVTDPILFREVSSCLYRRVFGLTTKHQPPKVIQYSEKVAHLSIIIPTRDVKLIRNYA